jgi:hypothetical protein
MEMKMMHNNNSFALFAWPAALAFASHKAPVKDDRSKRFIVFVTQFINRCFSALSASHQFQTRSKLRLKGHPYGKPHPPIPATLLHLAEKMHNGVKAAEDRRTPKRQGARHTYKQRDSVLECASPLAL